MLFSLAFLNLALGITSNPEQEGIPVIMCSEKAAFGLATKRHRCSSLASESGSRGVSALVCGHCLCETVKETLMVYVLAYVSDPASMAFFSFEESKVVP